MNASYSPQYGLKFPRQRSDLRGIGWLANVDHAPEALAVVVDRKYVGLVGVHVHGDPASRFRQKNARNTRFQFRVAVIGRYDEGNQGRAAQGTCAGNGDAWVRRCGCRGRGPVRRVAWTRRGCLADNGKAEGFGPYKYLGYPSVL